MCGIVGSASGMRAPDRTWLAAGRDAMRHRGPDDAGEWWSADGRVGLAHRRLSVIDTSAAGHQPMHDIRREIVVVFNGEIYNFPDLQRQLTDKGHAFQSRSDTEVLLAAYREWDTDCLSRLNGMFAFAIYDSRRERLFIARDRAGEKPLFYSATPGEIRFASELKGLTGSPGFSRRVDPLALDCYLATGFVPGDLCVFQDARKLPPAHALTFTLNERDPRLWRYWAPPEVEVRNQGLKEEPLVEELETLLSDAVRRQLIADVPIGVLLSGGVDSSLITALAARTKPDIRTYTIRFSGHKAYDETEHARLVAGHFGTDHTELDAAEATPDLLSVMARQYDEPLADSSLVPTFLVSRLVRQHCTVALGGDGGDELFGGYLHYSSLLRMQLKFGSTPATVRRSVASAATTLLPVGLKGRNWLQQLDTDIETGLPTVSRLFDPQTRAKLLGSRAPQSRTAESIRQQRTARSTDLLQSATRTDFENFLPDDVLVKVDRASMLNSLEIRAPMLDHRVIEFAFRQVPSDLKATPAGGKILLKKLAGRLLPPAFDLSRKQGFSIPLASWLRSGPWLNAFHDALLGEATGAFDRPTVMGLLHGQAKGRANSERLFGLVMFELWRREYGAIMPGH